MSLSLRKQFWAVAAIFISASSAFAVQTQVMIQGYLTNGSGTPYTTAQATEFRVYQGGNASTAGTGTLYYDELATITPSASGVFSYPLGSGTPTVPTLVAGGGTIPNTLSTTTFDTASAVYLEISVGGVVILPRLQMFGTPYAAIAGTAENLKPTNQPLITTGNLQASAGSFTASGNNQPSITTSSGIVSGGPVTAPAFVGTLYGNIVGSAPGAPPIGSIILYAGVNEPAGWIECDGRSMSQSGTSGASWGSFSTPPVFAAIGTLWGSSGPGSFNTPDLRGIFPRGWNHGKSSGFYDADATSRVAQYASGATGDSIGTYETDQFRSHTHNYIQGVWPGGVTAGGFNGSSGSNGWQPTTASGGNETRPMNASVMYIMRVQ